MTSLYTHRIWCNTEGTWVSTAKADNIPLAACPISAGHSAELGSAEITSAGVAPAQTHGNQRADSLVVSAPAGGSATGTKSWGVDVAVHAIQLAVTADCVGCSVTVEFAPRTAVGALTADAPIGSTVLHVTPPATAAITPGTTVTLQMGATVQEVGLATAVSAAENTVTVAVATTSNFLAAGPTAVQATKRPAQDMELPLGGYLALDMLGGGAAPVAVPAGRVVALALTNPNAAPARLVAIISSAY